MAYRTVYTLVLPDEAADKLEALARDNYRRPKEQAAVLLVDAIERAARRRRERPEPVR
jgi:hypothetical protein